MITRKAAVGFLLLAALVFPFAYSMWVPPIHPTGIIEPIKFQHYRDDSSANRSLEYKSPIATFDTPLELAVVVTGIIELFAIGCYLGLKRLEPIIKALEESERERVSKGNLK